MSLKKLYPHTEVPNLKVRQRDLAWVLEGLLFIWRDEHLYLCKATKNPPFESTYYAPIELIGKRITCSVYNSLAASCLSDPKLAGAPKSLLIMHTYLVARLCEQSYTINRLLLSTNNIAVIGKGGTGKSHILKEFVRRSRNNGKHVAVTAPTGVGAVNVNGFTLQSTMGIPIHVVTKEQAITMPLRKDVKKKIKGLHILVIDEISMVSAALLDIVDVLCKRHRDCGKPFGGIRVLCFGDFLQLAPVPPTVYHSNEANVKPKTLHTKYAFESKNWVFETIRLHFSFRHNDYDYDKILDSIRIGQCPPEVEFNRLANTQWPFLYGSNSNKDQHNQRMISRLSGKEYVYTLQCIKGEHLLDNIIKSIVPKKISLKIGAKVMITKNKMPLVNGDLGTVIAFKKNNAPLVLIHRLQETHAIDICEWEVPDFGGLPILVFKQIPLVLGWAFTVHKTQGLTLPGANVSMKDFSFKGQSYVALSRVKQKEHLTVQYFSVKKIKADKRAVKFSTKLR